MIVNMADSCTVVVVLRAIRDKMHSVKVLSVVQDVRHVVCLCNYIIHPFTCSVTLSESDCRFDSLSVSDSVALPLPVTHTERSTITKALGWIDCV